MEDEKEDSLGTDDRPPMVNGMAVPIREAPMKSARPGKRQQPMESEEYEVNGITSSVDGLMNVSSIWAWLRGNLSLGFPLRQFQTSLLSYRD